MITFFCKIYANITYIINLQQFYFSNPLMKFQRETNRNNNQNTATETINKEQKIPITSLITRIIIAALFWFGHRAFSWNNANRGSANKLLVYELWSDVRLCSNGVQRIVVVDQRVAKINPLRIILDFIVVTFSHELELRNACEEVLNYYSKVA